MKKLVSIIFHMDTMKFLYTKKNALINFLAVLPEIVTKACLKENIKHGFIKASIINQELNRYPVFNKILATCHQKPMLEEYRMVVDSFPEFLNIKDEEGHINEDHFDVCGTRMDMDDNGNNVFRAADIAQESYQRSKRLTHSQ
jgi:hypothetical protein